MRLRQIIEDTQPIRHTAEAFGDLLDYVYGLDEKTREQSAIDKFLRRPTPQNWERAKWVVNSLIRQVKTDPELNDRAQKWAKINDVTSPVVSSSIYDIDPKYTRGTPISGISLGRNRRNLLKQSLGPVGYMSSLASMGGKVAQHNIKRYLKTLAQDQDGLTAAVNADLRGVAGRKNVKRF